MAVIPGQRDLIQKPYLLLVEGPDDEGFFSGLGKHLGIGEKIQIIQLEGRDNLRGRLKAIERASREKDVVELISLGIVLDCEINPSGTSRKISDALKAAGFAVPGDALVLAGGKPQVVFMILPDKQMPGMLEDLCLQAFNTTSPSVMRCVDEYFACLKKENELLSKNDLSKAKVRTFLSSKEKAETRLGIAAQKDWWGWDIPVFDSVKYFLQQIIST